MAVIKATTYVKADHTVDYAGSLNWNKTDVLNALETAIQNIGMHGSSATQSGTVFTCLAPGSTESFKNGGYDNGNWKYCSNAVTYSSAHHYNWINVTANGNSAYTFQKYNTIDDIFGDGTAANSFYELSSGSGNATHMARHGIQTGDPIKYVNSGSGSDVGQLVNGTTYYAIVPTTPPTGAQISSTNDAGNCIQLAATVNDANNGTPFAVESSDSGVAGGFSGEHRLEEAALDNPDLTITAGDVITFIMDATGHPFYIQDRVAPHSPSRELKDGNYVDMSYREFPTNQGTESGANVVFNSENYPQGDYYYVCQNHSAMTGKITVLPGLFQNVDHDFRSPWWDYTVPASGGKSALPLRVYRTPSYWGADAGSVQSVKVMSETTNGWTTGDSFTIPGDQIGGVSPDNDIVFGVNSNTQQQQNNFNSVPSIVCADVGGGSSGFYIKYAASDKAIIEVENDNSKTYGTTYYGVKFNPSNDYQLCLTAMSDWDWLNYNPDHATDNENGRMKGVKGFDYQGIGGHPSFYWDTTYYRTFNFATSSSPTTYPLKIITHTGNAAAGQDPNFSTISFVQNINGNDICYFTLNIHKGSLYGNGIWDLDYVFNTGFTEIDATTEGIEINTYSASATYFGSTEDFSSSYSVRRDALYGYYRDADEGWSTYTGSTSYVIRNNIFYDNAHTPYDVVGYFRDSAVDKDTLSIYTGGATDTYASSSYYDANLNDVTSEHSIDTNANFYKPLKGIPISLQWAPCPYYMPDDFVTIQFNVSPGQTTFFFGDTITVDASEQYEIIQVGYTTQNTVGDGIANNTCKGIAFCARVV